LGRGGFVADRTRSRGGAGVAQQGGRCWGGGHAGTSHRLTRTGCNERTPGGKRADRFCAVGSALALVRSEQDGPAPRLSVGPDLPRSRFRQAGREAGPGCGGLAWSPGGAVALVVSRGGAAGCSRARAAGLRGSASGFASVRTGADLTRRSASWPARATGTPAPDPATVTGRGGLGLCLLPAARGGGRCPHHGRGGAGRGCRAGTTPRGTRGYGGQWESRPRRGPDNLTCPMARTDAGGGWSHRRGRGRAQRLRSRQWIQTVNHQPPGPRSRSCSVGVWSGRRGVVLQHPVLILGRDRGARNALTAGGVMALMGLGQKAGSAPRQPAPRGRVFVTVLDLDPRRGALRTRANRQAATPRSTSSRERAARRADAVPVLPRCVGDGVSVIAEVQASSPSKGSPGAIARPRGARRRLQDGGASVIRCHRAADAPRQPRDLDAVRGAVDGPRVAQGLHRQQLPAVGRPAPTVPTSCCSSSTALELKPWVPRRAGPVDRVTRGRGAQRDRGRPGLGRRGRIIGVNARDLTLRGHRSVRAAGAADTPTRRRVAESGVQRPA